MVPAVLSTPQQLNVSTDAIQSRPYHCRYMSCGVIGCMNLWLQGVDGMTGEGLIEELDEMINCFLEA